MTDDESPMLRFNEALDREHQSTVPDIHARLWRLAGRGAPSELLHELRWRGDESLVAEAEAATYPPAQNDQSPRRSEE